MTILAHLDAIDDEGPNAVVFFPLVEMSKKVLKFEVVVSL